MRRSPRALLFVLFPAVATLTATPLHANPAIEARRELAAAKLAYRHYRFVEFPRTVRQLDAQIKLTRAEIDSLKRHLREYRPFSKFDTGKPLFHTIERVKLYLLDAELRLKNLRAERSALYRYRGDHCRLLAVRIHEARLAVAQLEGGGEIIVVEPEPTQAVVTE